ncbi:hypothetical protein HNQ80_002239 [Anaerosolibacter carboniphilus]|uniref:Uncharacterized protein n=1 Tax=Anaerosolibacter carboniphilus TaxID=1417629 RepID=A0A841KVU5_9FIRM|nr:hypothetical protein [Anaerosolibacter carboniphilus]MBB6216140.1 hypothetical protein [Anaerosolibacter carboniphilus]
MKNIQVLNQSLSINEMLDEIISKGAENISSEDLIKINELLDLLAS